MAEQCNGGYDFEAKSNIAYECPICKNIIKKFTELPCECNLQKLHWKLGETEIWNVSWNWWKVRLNFL